MRLTLSSCILTLVCASTASAQSPGRDTPHERSIEAQLAAIAPEAVPTFRDATAALDRRDLTTAKRLYTEVLQSAPSFTPALRRLAGAQIETGEPERGLALLERAVNLERSPDNLITLAGYLMFHGRDKKPSPPELERALALAKEAATFTNRTADVDVFVVMAQAAASLQRLKDFRYAVGGLRKEFPDDPRTHYFTALLDAADEHWIAAEREIQEAERLGLSHEAVAAVLNSGIRTRARIWRAVRASSYALVLWASGLGVLFVAGRWLSGQTLRSIESMDTDGEHVPAREMKLRRVYRALIHFAAVYYYVSLPFVALLVVGTAAAAYYGFMLIGRIPVQFMAMLTVGAAFTVYKMIQTLFVKMDNEEPGRPLAIKEAPGLWALTREVADQVGTRTIDQIRITPGTELAVYERGTRRERARDEGYRTLLLGVGVLNGFGTAAFRAVLAHEYGHFAHRDTAGGDIALRVQQDMVKFAHAIVRGGLARPWNGAFHFLRIYNFLFRRISHGAARLQEVLADRVAAMKYGAAAFEEGLRHVIGANVRFAAACNAEIKTSLEARQPCRNLYALAPSGPEIEKLVVDMIERPATEDDTHPAPLDRFRLTRGVTASVPPMPSGLIWDLFVDRERLTEEMTEEIRSYVAHEPSGAELVRERA
jgi:hypothetical protein